MIEITHGSEWNVEGCIYRWRDRCHEVFLCGTGYRCVRFRIDKHAYLHCRDARSMLREMFEYTTKGA